MIDLFPFREDIVLDEEAFDRAVGEFADLSTRLQNLRNDMEQMLNDLKAGFDTPAGTKFINACKTTLFSPMDDQKLVLDHISSTLQESREAYRSVFDSYESLQSTINQAANNN